MEGGSTALVSRVDPESALNLCPIMGWVVWVTRFLKTLVSCDSKFENMILDQIGDLQAKYRAPWVTSSGLFPKSLIGKQNM